MFCSEKEIELSDQFLKNGYCISKTHEKENLDFLREQIFKILVDNSFIKSSLKLEEFFYNTHKYIDLGKLNDVRLLLIQGLAKNINVRPKYYKIFKNELELIVGNELVMQKRLNLSIQLPKDTSSLLSIHADTWSGDSPFETVCWLPLVDCKKTMCMFILPAYEYEKFVDIYKNMKNKNSEDLFNEIKNLLQWLEIDYGQTLIFNQNLPHGNIVNDEDFSRWSFNCRFKSIFTPYADKRIGEFFEPVTLKPASKFGMEYKYLDFEE